MRLSDFKGEAALDALADMMEPLTTILLDEEIQKLAKNNAAPISYVKPMLKNCKNEVIAILAILDCKTVEEYKANMTLLSLPKQVLDLVMDPEVQSLFHSQEQTAVIALASSGPAMENTEASES